MDARFCRSAEQNAGSVMPSMIHSISAICLFAMAVLLRQFRNLREFGKNIGIPTGAVGNQTVGTILDSLTCITEFSAAPVTQRVQRAVAEQAAKIFR